MYRIILEIMSSDGGRVGVAVLLMLLIGAVVAVLLRIS